MVESSQQPARRRRARRVCLDCHNRKLKCDLESRLASGSASCTNCIHSECACRPWQSKRRLRAQRRRENLSKDQVTGPPFSLSDGSVADQPFQADNPQQSHLTSGQDSTGAANRSEFAHNQFPTSRTFENRPNQCLQTSSVDEVSPISHQTVDSSNTTAVSSFGNSGFLTLFEPEHRTIAASNDTGAVQLPLSFELPALELQQSFIETYFEYCWPWCPVLTKDEVYDSLGANSTSRLLMNALALLGTRIRPPITQSSTAADYYNRAKMLFYTDQEPDPIACLQSIALFYWWVPRGPSTVHKDASWYWTGLAIKYAQQIGLHREPEDIQKVGGEKMQALRRRIWWTLFARERLTSLCQGRPCTINLDDCTIREPSEKDFGISEDGRSIIFIHWTRLCGIVGRVGQHLQRSPELPVPVDVSQSLIRWIQSLPSELNLPFTTSHTRNFNRDVHGLHLPYLTTLIIMHMNHSSSPLPEARTAAVLAASCIARIFRDFLARGDLCFLGAIGSWYCAMAILALLQTRRMDNLSAAGKEDIRVLHVALDTLGTMWPSAAVFIKGFERLGCFHEGANGSREHDLDPLTTTIGHESMTELGTQDIPFEVDWTEYFPYITADTSPLAGILLSAHDTQLWTDFSWLQDSALQLQGLFDSIGI